VSCPANRFGKQSSKKNGLDESAHMVKRTASSNTAEPLFAERANRVKQLSSKTRIVLRRYNPGKHSTVPARRSEGPNAACQNPPRIKLTETPWDSSPESAC
jgi:hypothetical protein